MISDNIWQKVYRLIVRQVFFAETESRCHIATTCLDNLIGQ